jgi:hypothetical protein
MSIDAFRQMSGQVETMVDLLALPGLAKATRSCAPGSRLGPRRESR